MPEYQGGRHRQRKGADYRGTPGVLVDSKPLLNQTPSDVIPRSEIMGLLSQEISARLFGAEQEFSTPGNFLFQAPSGAVNLILVSYGAGGSGGTGSRGASTVVRGGGGAGSAGAYGLFDIDLRSLATKFGCLISDLWFELTVGGGGAVKQGPTTNDTAGTAGLSGGTNLLRVKNGPLGTPVIIARVSGGAAGGAGTTAGNAAGGGPVSTFAQFVGGVGGNGGVAATGVPVVGGSATVSAGGGAGAPSITAAGVAGSAVSGGAGATCSFGDLAPGGTPALGQINAPVHSIKGCPGGGGSTPPINAPATNSISGSGFRGGGGGGGLPSNNGSTVRYDSGKGGDGYCWIRWR